MIQISNLSKSYGAQDLFNNISLTMEPGERLGIVGKNGHGKSTLFKIILGLEEADSGKIIIPEDYRIGHLSQHLVFPNKTTLDEVDSALPELEGGWKETYKAEA